MLPNSSRKNLDWIPISDWICALLPKKDFPYVSKQAKQEGRAFSGRERFNVYFAEICSSGTKQLKEGVVL